ncbi:protein-(glutamine-N5) methyltransferase, release factor-specific [Shuttleworthella satelles DSM 14600]|uniref:Release factor glutamine methyltransferase n=1 Tax=Shuttleworthella satelles DSM 14600 TaxID=626523 RepID=C4GAL0_9FIRM|nr:protein-(glutamine-N5) methyltransferase, release factor-specific [Shuttleworthia satelles DSM 14600]
MQTAQVPDFALDAGYLLEFASGRRHVDLILSDGEQMPDALLGKYRSCIERRAQRIPLQQITGSQAFMGLDFMVNEHVLCPRQDTETLVEEGLTILASLQSGSVKNRQANADREIRLLDLCTGSGCILISLLALARGQETPIHGLAADLSPEALAVARENAKRNGVSAAFVLSDLFAEIEGSFDLITANPPYIPSGQLEDLMPEVRDHEPRMALDGDEDGLAFYRRIAGQAPDYLREGGWLLMEIAFDQGQAVRQMLADGPFEEIEIIQDLSGRDRVLKGRMIHV